MLVLLTNAGGSAICIHEDILPGDAIVTHVVACQGRNHIVNIRSGCRSVVVVNVHFEPELTMRSLRERLRHHPTMIMGDFHIGEPEEGRFSVWNQTFTDGDMWKSALLQSVLPHVLGIAQSDSTRRYSSVSWVFRTLSVNIPMAEAHDFHCFSHVIENLVKRSIPSDHAAVRVAFPKPTIRGHQGKRIPSWMSKHPVFCSDPKRLDDDHLYPVDPFGALADF